ncbi:uncharacterized protein LOC127878662 [Dreissena polymorpha]|uniref:uncharacterized protein LOC127878662 n=1 Tax=Dreissena polymorpha TaxID=45954 RepID=UPI0022645A60|nr:uncharacterized protein LOC127878662 [Dreissena polymorpha]
MNDSTLVYPYNGSLYAYNVTNLSSAEPVPPDNVITGDGWEDPKLVTVVNGKLPGPDIIVYEGQDVVVHVKNGLRSEGTTIHWHGLPQVGTPWMDGVPYVTQCPILPGQSFTYRVSIDAHTLTVVASDGYDIDPEEMESFVINPGERFDFEIMANQPVVWR